MPVSYDYDPKLNAVIVHLKGTVTKEEVLDYLDRLLADNSIQKGNFEIVDLSVADSYAVTEEDLAEIALKGEEVSAAKGMRRSYYYAESTHAYSIAKTLQDLAEDLCVEVEVYRDWEHMVRVMGMRTKEGL